MGCFKRILMVFAVCAVALSTCQNEDEYPEDATRLDFSAKGITEVLADFSGFIELEEIDYSNNDIIDIKPDAFRENAKLKRIDLSGNKNLAFPQSGPFLETDARILNLSNCHIESVPADALNGMKNLDVLDLTNNNIDFVNSPAFENLLHPPRKLILSEISPSDLQLICKHVDMIVVIKKGGQKESKKCRDVRGNAKYQDQTKKSNESEAIIEEDYDDVDMTIIEENLLKVRSTHMEMLSDQPNEGSGFGEEEEAVVDDKSENTSIFDIEEPTSEETNTNTDGDDVGNGGLEEGKEEEEKAGGVDEEKDEEKRSDEDEGMDNENADQNNEDKEETNENNNQNSEDNEELNVNTNKNSEGNEETNENAEEKSDRNNGEETSDKNEELIPSSSIPEENDVFSSSKPSEVINESEMGESTEEELKPVIIDGTGARNEFVNEETVPKRGKGRSKVAPKMNKEEPASPPGDDIGTDKVSFVEVIANKTDENDKSNVRAGNPTTGATTESPTSAASSIILILIVAVVVMGSALIGFRYYKNRKAAYSPVNGVSKENPMEGKELKEIVVAKQESQPLMEPRVDVQFEEVNDEKNAEIKDEKETAEEKAKEKKEDDEKGQTGSKENVGKNGENV